MKKFSIILGAACILAAVLAFTYGKWNHSVGAFCDSDVEALSGCEVTTKYGSNFDRCDGENPTTCSLSYHGTYKGVRIDADLTCNGTKVYARK